MHDVAELWMVSAGRGRITAGDSTILVSPGDMVLFPSRVPHQITNTGTEALRLFTVWWSVTP